MLSYQTHSTDKDGQFERHRFSYKITLDVSLWHRPTGNERKEEKTHCSKNCWDGSYAAWWLRRVDWCGLDTVSVEIILLSQALRNDEGKCTVYLVRQVIWKIWWDDVKEDMKGFHPFQRDAQVWNKCSNKKGQSKLIKMVADRAFARADNVAVITVKHGN